MRATVRLMAWLALVVKSGYLTALGAYLVACLSSQLASMI